MKYFDKDEQDLIESIENADWGESVSEDQNKQYQEYAQYSLNKSKRINIRMSERDLRKIQVKAIQEGLPYQSLISMLIHKYNEGKIKILN